MISRISGARLWRLWLAELKAANEPIQNANLQDAHWKWKEKHQDRTARAEWESYSVECDGKTQGLMFIQTLGFAREKGQLNKPIAYIDIISTAPWNRYGFDGTPKYKGIGHLLLGAAVSLSMDEGFDGRVGLHSLPQSESWQAEVYVYLLGSVISAGSSSSGEMSFT